MILDNKCNGGTGSNGWYRLDRADRLNRGNSPDRGNGEIAAWGEWMEREYPFLEYEWYMITLTFNQIGGRRDAIINEMEKEADLIYDKVLTRIYRNPREELYLPLLVMHPDLPVPKKSKHAMTDVTINWGLHFAGIFIIPKRSRLKGQSLNEHVASQPNVYKSHSGKLRAIHITRIDRTPRNAVSYCFKTLQRGWIEQGYTFIRPKARSELTSNLPPIAKQRTAVHATDNRPSASAAMRIDP